MKTGIGKAVLTCILLLCVGPWAARAQVSTPQIHSPVDETQRVALAGNTPVDAQRAVDLGRVPDNMPLAALQIALRRPATQEYAVEALIHDQLDRKSIQYPKPSWQSGILGNPNDQVRDLPDVSIFAGGSEWGHSFPFCNSFDAGGSCTNGPQTWEYSGGTSFSAPIFAGIQALINQRYGGAVGNPDLTYYELANEEYGRSGNPSCQPINVSTGNSCIFYDVSELNSSTGSTTVVPCEGSNSCYLPSGEYGVLSTSTSSYVGAYTSQLGWDFTTGLGTPNVTNLVNAWRVP